MMQNGERLDGSPIRSVFVCNLGEPPQIIPQLEGELERARPPNLAPTADGPRAGATVGVKHPRLTVISNDAVNEARMLSKEDCNLLGNLPIKTKEALSKPTSLCHLDVLVEVCTGLALDFATLLIHLLALLVDGNRNFPIHRFCDDRRADGAKEHHVPLVLGQLGDVIRMDVLASRLGPHHLALGRQLGDVPHLSIEVCLPKVNGAIHLPSIGLLHQWHPLTVTS